MDDRHSGDHDAWCLLRNALRGAVPAGRFNVEAIDVDSIYGSLLNQINFLEVLQILLAVRLLGCPLIKGHEIEFELQEIDGFHVLSCE